MKAISISSFPHIFSMVLCTTDCADSTAQLADKVFAQPIVQFGEFCEDLR